MPPFRVAYVPGVTVSKWARVWSERHPDVALELVGTDESTALTTLRSTTAVDVLFARLPVDGDGDGLAVIPLYSERQFVVVSRDHVIAAVDEVTLTDLADETLLDGPAEETVALAAASAGVAIMPQSLARLHARRDVVSRPVTDAAETGVGLVWVQDATDERIEDFIGIARGRTARSSRGTSPAAATAVERPRARDRPKPKRESVPAHRRRRR